MGREFWNAVEENPIIAAVKCMDDLEQCCKLEDIRVVFIFFLDMIYFIFFGIFYLNYLLLEMMRNL